MNSLCFRFWRYFEGNSIGPFQNIQYNVYQKDEPNSSRIFRIINITNTFEIQFQFSNVSNVSPDLKQRYFKEPDHGHFNCRRIENDKLFKTEAEKKYLYVIYKNHTYVIPEGYEFKVNEHTDQIIGRPINNSVLNEANNDYKIMPFSYKVWEGLEEFIDLN